jgi:hypothetical protein
VVAAAKTHRELFSEFYRDLLREPLEHALAVSPRPAASVALYERMMHDIMTGGQTRDPLDQVRCLNHCTHAGMVSAGLSSHMQQEQQMVQTLQLQLGLLQCSGVCCCAFCQ